MYQSWMLKYRPKEFTYILGQDHVTMVLQGMLSKGFITPSMILAGPWGVGKTSIARITAKVLLCGAPLQGKACGTCESCLSFEAGVNINYLECDAASSGKVADIRELVKLCAYPPIGSNKRVIVLDEAHRITPEGWHALLKTLEECVEHTVFIFCTTEPDKILDTIKSRSRVFDLRPVESSLLVRHMAAILTCEGVPLPDPTVLDSIADLAKGHVRDSLNLLEQLYICGDISQDNLLKLTNKVDSLKIKAGLVRTIEEPAFLLSALPEWLQYFTPQEIAHELQDLVVKHQLNLWKVHPEGAIAGLGDAFPLMDWLNLSPTPTTHLQLQNYVLQFVGRLKLKGAPQVAQALTASPAYQAQPAAMITPPPMAPAPAPSKKKDLTLRTPLQATPRIKPETATETTTPIDVPWVVDPPVAPVPVAIPQASSSQAMSFSNDLPAIAPSIQPISVAAPPAPQQASNPNNFLAQFAVKKPIPAFGEASEV